jgi:hypothetical protein
MKTNELRIGNLVYDLENNIIEVHGLYKQDIFNEITGEIPINCIKPIPITDEWFLLFMFTFYKSPNKRTCYQLKNGSQKTNNYTVFSLYKYWDGYMINCGHKYKQVTSIHELQNLYFMLTGNDLTPKYSLP